MPELIRRLLPRGVPPEPSGRSWFHPAISPLRPPRPHLARDQRLPQPLDARPKPPPA